MQYKKNIHQIMFNFFVTETAMTSIRPPTKKG
jgi:hypothetical protein